MIKLSSLEALLLLEINKSNAELNINNEPVTLYVNNNFFDDQCKEIIEKLSISDFLTESKNSNSIIYTVNEKGKSVLSQHFTSNTVGM